MTKSAEEQPAAVSAKTIRAREILRLIVQVEPKVWTERMLTALVQGVKGGKWFSLIDKVHPERTLQAAFSQVAANQGAAGVDHVTISMFETRLDEELRRLSEHLRNGTYRPQAIRRHYIPKPGTQDRATASKIPVILAVLDGNLVCSYNVYYWHIFNNHPNYGCKSLEYSQNFRSITVSGFPYLMKNPHFDAVALGRRRSGRWASRRSETGWFKRQCEW